MATIEPTQERAPTGLRSSTSVVTLSLVMLVGMYFGIVLTKSEVVRWQRVHDMFLFKEAHMYLIITTGILVGMVSLQLLKRMPIRSLQGKSYTYKAKPFHLGTIFGGTLFGAGWAMTGACPGPIYAQLGAGAWMAWVTLLGALVGMYLFAWLKPRLPY